MKIRNDLFCVSVIVFSLVQLNSVFAQSRLYSSGEDRCPCEGMNLYESYNNPLFSPDNRHILFAGNNVNGVYLYDSQIEEIVQLSSGSSSGYKYYWSPDGQKVGFKQLIKTGQRSFMQVPIVYDIVTKKATALCEPVMRCGVPSFSTDGKIVYSVDKEIMVLNSNLQLLRKISVPTYTNLTPVSPDGQKILFNDADDQIWMINIDGSNSTKLTIDADTYFSPVWSPDSKKVAVQTISGKIKVVDIVSRQMFDLGEGRDASWYNDNNYVVYNKITKNNIYQINKISINVAKYDGTEKSELLFPAQNLVGNVGISQDGQTMVYKDYNTNKFYSAPIVSQTSTVRGSKFAMGSTQEVLFTSEYG